MNKVIMTGRLCRNIELRTLPTGSITADFTLAVDRRKKDDGADFIVCVAWGKTAELMNQYVHKGDKVGVAGRIQTGEYTDKNGIKRFTTKVIIEDVEFLQGKRNSDTSTPTDNGNIDAPNDMVEVDDDDLPF